MITNNSSERRKFIPHAIQNFIIQTYSNKHLIIINHGSDPILCAAITAYPNISEFMVSKLNNTLGDLRNHAFNFVPSDAYWTTFDDDDIRGKNYFEYLVKNIENNDALFFRNRMEFNINNEYVYQSRFVNGTPHFLCKKINEIRYLSKDSLEDIDIYKNLLDLKKKVKVVENDPILYIRIIHTNNTSLYVDANKSKIINYSLYSDYQEFEVNEKQSHRVKNIYLSINKNGKYLQ